MAFCSGPVRGGHQNQCIFCADRCGTVAGQRQRGAGLFFAIRRPGQRPTSGTFCIGAEGLRGGAAYKELEENFYPALGFVNRVGVTDLTADVGYTWYTDNSWLRTIYSGVDYQRVDVIDGELQSEQIAIRALELSNDMRDKISFQYFLLQENLTEPFEISDGVVIPVGDYSFDQYCVNVSTGDFRAVAVGGYYCGGEFFDGDQDVGGGFVTWRPSEHFLLYAQYDISDTKLPSPVDR